MRIYVTGAKGVVGRELIKLGCFPIDVDVSDFDAVEKEITRLKPEVIAHLASKSDVDWCESPENTKEVIKVNIRGTWNVCINAEQLHIPVAVLSTDHIFDGKKGKYKEDYVRTKPVNYYGLSKASMEGLVSGFDNAKIVRMSFLFHYDRVQNMMKAAKELGFSTFISRSMMYVPHFALSLKRYLDRIFEMPKILNISGSEIVNLYEFALAYASVFDYPKDDIKPRKKEDKSFIANRPHKAGLDVSLSKKLGLPQFSYLDGLKAMKVDKMSRELGY